MCKCYWVIISMQTIFHLILVSRVNGAPLHKFTFLRLCNTHLDTMGFRPVPEVAALDAKACSVYEMSLLIQQRTFFFPGQTSWSEVGCHSSSSQYFYCNNGPFVPSIQRHIPWFKDCKRICCCQNKNLLYIEHGPPSSFWKRTCASDERKTIFP